MILGVDVGGTNTDAVLMDGASLIASGNLPTTPDVSNGIVSAIRSVLRDSGVATERIQCVAIGTTHFTNAFVAREELLNVGLIRVALPASSGVLPMSDWPPELAAAIGDNMVLVGGGYHVDGRVDSELDELAVRDAARGFRGDLHRDRQFFRRSLPGGLLSAPGDPNRHRSARPGSGISVGRDGSLGPWLRCRILRENE